MNKESVNSKCTQTNWFICLERLSFYKEDKNRMAIDRTHQRYRDANIGELTRFDFKNIAHISMICTK